MVYLSPPEWITLLWWILGWYCIACLICGSVGGLVPFLLKGEREKDNYMSSYRKCLIAGVALMMIWFVILSAITSCGNFAIR